MSERLPLRRAAHHGLALAAGLVLAAALLLAWPWLCELAVRAESRTYCYARAIGGRP